MRAPAVLVDLLIIIAHAEVRASAPDAGRAADAVGNVAGAGEGASKSSMAFGSRPVGLDVPSPTMRVSESVSIQFVSPLGGRCGNIPDSRRECTTVSWYSVLLLQSRCGPRWPGHG